MSETILITTPEVTAGPCDLAVPHVYKDPKTGVTGEPKYRLSFTVKQSDPFCAELIKTIRKAALDIEGVQEKKGGGFFVTLPNGDTRTLKLPYETGENINARLVAGGGKALDYLAGTVQFSAISKDQPEMIDRFGNALTGKEVTVGSSLCVGLGVRGASNAVFSGVLLYVNQLILIKQGSGQRRAATDVFADVLAKLKAAGVTSAPAADEDLAL